MVIEVADSKSDARETKKIITEIGFLCSGCRAEKASGCGDELWRIVRLRNAPARFQFNTTESVFQSKSFGTSKAEPEMLNLGLFFAGRGV